MMATITQKEGAVTSRCPADVNIIPTHDDQYIVIHIQTPRQQIEITLHISEALEISGRLEDQVQANVRSIDAVLYDSATEEATA